MTPFADEPYWPDDEERGPYELPFFGFNSNYEEPIGIIEETPEEVMCMACNGTGETVPPELTALFRMPTDECPICHGSGLDTGATL